MKGYVQVYSGNGKGKTTAALGLALRAVGSGLKVYIGQFIKGSHYSELDALARLSESITVKQYGQSGFIRNKPSETDRKQARAGLEDIKKIVTSGTHQLVIMDEVNIAVYYQLVTVDELLELIDSKNDSVELVLTGRYADPRVIDRADLVTEMKDIKHYYQDGVKARTGIEK
jgi:cob(I)alamin adenosyltransferase